MNLMDAMLGHRRLMEMGFSVDVIRRVCSERPFDTEQEMLDALRLEQDRASGVEGAEP